MAVYLVKVGPKSFGDGHQNFARIKKVIWDQLLSPKAELSCNFVLCKTPQSKYIIGQDKLVSLFPFVYRL